MWRIQTYIVTCRLALRLLISVTVQYKIQLLYYMYYTIQESSYAGSERSQKPDVRKMPSLPSMPSFKMEQCQRC